MPPRSAARCPAPPPPPCRPGHLAGRGPHFRQTTTEAYGDRTASRLARPSRPARPAALPGQINAGHFTPTDATLIPTGQIAPVAGTPFELTHPKPIGRDITDNNIQLIQAHGFDHNWVLNSSGPAFRGLHLASRAFDPASGRLLTVWTDQPGVQFCTGNFLDGSLVGISGHSYRQSWGYTFETQHFPHSPNHPNFPSTELKPGQMFKSTTFYSFSTVHGH